MARPKGARTYLKHTDHAHPQTKAARARCRRVFEQTGQPWDGTEPDYDSLTRGEKAAATRRRNAALADQAEAVDRLLDATQGGPSTEPSSVSEPIRDSEGRFTRSTLELWGRLIDHLEGAQSYIIDNGIDLVEARLETTLGGQTFIATYDGEWTVTAQPSTGRQ